MQLNTRKGRGVPLSDGEKRRIDELQERGCNQKEIAEMLGRNRKTVGKYMNLRGRHLEARVR